MSLKKILSTIDYIRNEQSLDCPIAMTGWEQMGKSTLAIKIFKKLFYDGGSIEQFLEKYLAYTTDELEPKMFNMEKFGGVIGDEAIRWGYNRNWNRNENKETIVNWRQIGFKKLLAFFNLPDFWELDKALRGRRVKLWIHVFAKGHAAIFQPDTNCMNFDPWFQKEVFKNMEFMSQFDSWEKHFIQYRKCKTFLDHIEFGPLNDEWFDVYSKISEERKIDKENRTPDKALIHRNELALWVNQLGKSEYQISTRLKTPRPTIQDWIQKAKWMDDGDN